MTPQQQPSALGEVGREVEVKPTSSPLPTQGPQLNLWWAEGYVGYHKRFFVYLLLLQNKPELSWQRQREEAPWSGRAKGSCFLGKLRIHLISEADWKGYTGPSLVPTR